MRTSNDLSHATCNDKVLFSSLSIKAASTHCPKNQQIDRSQAKLKRINNRQCRARVRPRRRHSGGGPTDHQLQCPGSGRRSWEGPAATCANVLDIILKFFTFKSFARMKSRVALLPYAKPPNSPSRFLLYPSKFCSNATRFAIHSHTFQVLPRGVAGPPTPAYLPLAKPRGQLLGDSPAVGGSMVVVKNLQTLAALLGWVPVAEQQKPPGQFFGKLALVSNFQHVFVLNINFKKSDLNYSRLSGCRFSLSQYLQSFQTSTFLLSRYSS